jgi:hypothetical protein
LHKLNFKESPIASPEGALSPDVPGQEVALLASRFVVEQNGNVCLAH